MGGVNTTAVDGCACIKAPTSFFQCLAKVGRYLPADEFRRQRTRDESMIPIDDDTDVFGG